MPLSFSRTRLALLVALASTLILFAAPRADAAWGDLDTSFAAPSGYTQALPAGNAYGSLTRTAVQPDGKILVAGGGGVDFFNATLMVQRFLADGTPDPTFGSGGTALIPAPAGGAGMSIDAIALQSDGKIVCVGGNASTGKILRLTSGGALDTTFAAPNGYINYASERPTDVIVHSSGDIYMAEDNTTGRPQLRRYNSSGTEIGTFRTTSNSNLASATFVDYQPVMVREVAGGLLMVAAGGTSGSMNFFAAKLDGTGALDTGWGTGGKSNTTFSTSAAPSDVVVQASGAIVMVGATNVMGDAAWTLARLTAGGTLDPTFVSGGKQEVNPSADGDFLVGASATPTGGLVAVGAIADAATSDYVGSVVMMDANGNPLSGFGPNGIRTLQLVGSNAFQDVAMQPDGKVIAAGTLTKSGGPSTPVTARFLNEPAPTPPVPVLGAKVTSPKGKKISAKKLTKFAGSATTTVGSVTKVEIAVQRVDKKLLKKSKRCLWLSSSKVKFKRVKAVKSKCSKPKWLKASGTSKWSFKLKKGKRLPKASYVLQVRVTSDATVTTFASARKFTVK